MKRSKNTMEHYGGIPNTDECMEFVGELSVFITLIGIGLLIILKCGGIL